MKIKSLFKKNIEIIGNFITVLGGDGSSAENQNQTKEIFSDKWEEVDNIQDVETLYTFQYNWFLELYGFGSEEKLKEYLKDKKVILDTGCGLGYKAAWFARLAPHAIVIGIDISEAANIAAKNFNNVSNLFFFKGDISETGLKNNSIDFVVCDQVIMHTEKPENTFKHLSQITKYGGDFACYVYTKKALPRELIDDYFRIKTHDISNEEMWEFSKQLTTLGKTLSDLKIEIHSPEIPLLGIKEGTYDIQRFIYWNFLKCFWRDDWSFELNTSCNYDWYAPSNAKRFSKAEFQQMIFSNDLEIKSFHEEEACYSGVFTKKQKIKR